MKLYLPKNRTNHYPTKILYLKFEGGLLYNLPTVYQTLIPSRHDSLKCPICNSFFPTEIIMLGNKNPKYRFVTLIRCLFDIESEVQFTMVCLYCVNKKFNTLIYDGLKYSDSLIFKPYIHLYKDRPITITNYIDDNYVCYHQKYEYGFPHMYGILCVSCHKIYGYERNRYQDRECKQIIKIFVKHNGYYMCVKCTINFLWNTIFKVNVNKCITHLLLNNNNDDIIEHIKKLLNIPILIMCARKLDINSYLYDLPLELCKYILLYASVWNGNGFVVK